MAGLVRFVVDEPGDAPPQGVFQIAYELSRRPDRSGVYHGAICSALDWFETELPVPKRLVTSRSKGWYRRKPQTVCWFKPTAEQALSRMRDLCAALEQLDIPTRMITTERPGYVVHEDEFQVVALPFRDTI